MTSKRITSASEIVIMEVNNWPNWEINTYQQICFYDQRITLPGPTLSMIFDWCELNFQGRYCIMSSWPCFLGVFEKASDFVMVKLYWSIST